MYFVSEPVVLPDVKTYTMLSHQNPGDFVITSSSEYNVTHGADRALVTYYDGTCGGASWSAATCDREPWVQFTFNRRFLVYGLWLKNPCDAPNIGQRIKSVQVTKSDDGEEWCNVSGITPVIYNTTNTTDGGYKHGSVFFLDTFNIGQYWRINVKTWLHHPSMKLDLSGERAWYHKANPGLQ